VQGTGNRQNQKPEARSQKPGIRAGRQGRGGERRDEIGEERGEERGRSRRLKAASLGHSVKAERRFPGLVSCEPLSGGA